MNSWTRKKCKLLVPRDGSVNVNQLAQVVETERAAAAKSVVRLAKQILAAATRDGKEISGAALVDKLHHQLLRRQGLKADKRGEEGTEFTPYYPPIEDELIAKIVNQIVLDAPLRLKPNDAETTMEEDSWQDRTVNLLADGLIQMLDESHKIHLSRS